MTHTEVIPDAYKDVLTDVDAGEAEIPMKQEGAPSPNSLVKTAGGRSFCSKN